MDDNRATDDDDAMTNNDNAVTDNDEAMDDDGTIDGDDAVMGDNTAKESGEAIDNDSASDAEVDRGAVHKASAPKQGVKHFMDSDEDDSAPGMSGKKKMCGIDVLVEGLQRDSALEDNLAQGQNVKREEAQRCLSCQTCRALAKIIDLTDL